MTFIRYFSICLLFCGTAAIAANETTKPEVSISGFLDAYYSYNFNRPRIVTTPNASSVSNAALPAANNTYRYYDTYHNQMTLSLAELTIKAKHREVSLLTDLDFGPFADLNASIASSSGTSIDETSKHIGQAIVTYQPIDSRFSMDVGKMYTHVGLETAKSKDNFNYSKTVLFSYGMPFWHTGLRTGYAVIPDKLQANLFIYNGWNSTYDNNESKSFGAQLRFTASQDLNVVYNFLCGPEQASNETHWKSIHELNATWTLNAHWLIATDLLTGNEDEAPVGATTKRATWYGGLLLIKYQLSDSSYLSPRYEIYRDQEGYTLSSIPQTIQTSTLTFGHYLSDGLETRSEMRFDKSSEKSFPSSDGNKDSQATFLVSMLFGF